MKLLYRSNNKVNVVRRENILRWRQVEGEEGGRKEKRKWRRPRAR